jgi:hypothetical protein
MEEEDYKYAFDFPWVLKKKWAYVSQNDLAKFLSFYVSLTSFSQLTDSEIKKIQGVTKHLLKVNKK